MGINGLNKGPCTSCNRSNMHSALTTDTLVWDNRQPTGTVKPLVALKDWTEHKRRRQPWNLAFGREAMKGYEKLVVESARSLLEAFSQQENSTIDIGQWMTYFA
jgi:cytochrome P450